MTLETISVTGPTPGAGGMIHATSVECAGNGVLILGQSGSGKSALALELMAYGASLVADDKTKVTVDEGRLVASAPATIQGKIEARFVGILHARDAGPTPIALVVDMDREEGQRLPPHREIILLGKSLPLLHYSTRRHFPAAILQILKTA